MTGLGLGLLLAVGLTPRAEAAWGPLFTDEFNRTSGLGPAWRVAHGAFATTGQLAVGTAPSSYAVWSELPPGDVHVTALLGPQVRTTYVGVVARAADSAPARDHYAAYLSPSGAVGLSRRNGWVYRTLATGAVVPSGPHELTLEVAGSSPVQLRVLVDGAEVLRYSDADASAFTSGRVGVFDYAGAASPIDRFSVSAPSRAPSFDAAQAQAVLLLAQQKLERLAAQLPSTQYPKATRPDGTWSTVPNTDLIGWTQGFFPGSLWAMFEHTADPAWRTRAERWTRSLELQKTNRQTHDLGFKLFLSFGAAYRLTQDPYVRGCCSPPQSRSPRATGRRWG